MDIVQTLAVLIVLPIFLVIGILPFEIINMFCQAKDLPKAD